MPVYLEFKQKDVQYSTLKDYLERESLHVERIEEPKTGVKDIFHHSLCSVVLRLMPDGKVGLNVISRDISMEKKVFGELEGILKGNYKIVPTPKREKRLS